MWWAWTACRSEGPEAVVGPEVRLLVSEPGSEVARGSVLSVAFRLDEDGDGLDEEGWAFEANGDGTLAWAVAAPLGQRLGRATWAADGSVLLMEGVPEGATEAGRIVRYSPEEGELGSTDAPHSHHDVAELPDGRLAWLGHRFDRVPFGPPGADPSAAPVTVDLVVVGEEGGTGEVLVDHLEDYPVAPWWICDHNTLSRRIEGQHDLVHANSLVPDRDGGWLVMLRYLDAIVRYGPDGTFDWQLGGRDSDFEQAPDAVFRHGHFTEAFGDRVLVFDNGNEHGRVAPSRVVELVVDRAARTSTLAWQYAEPDALHTRFLGDAKRLPGGNTLIAWGNLGRIDEVSPDGEVLWSIELGMPVGRVEFRD